MHQTWAGMKGSFHVASLSAYQPGSELSLIVVLGFQILLKPSTGEAQAAQDKPW